MNYDRQIAELKTKIEGLRARIDRTWDELAIVAGAGVSAFAPNPHPLNSVYHSGQIGDAQAPQFVMLNGTRALTADWDAGDYQVRARRLYADVPDGIAPLVVTSTTLVANLNVDQLDGKHYSDISGEIDGGISAHASIADAHHALVSIGTGGLSAKLAVNGQVLTLAGIAHDELSGLSDDDHPQYGALAQDEAVTGAWGFQNTVTTRNLQPEMTEHYDIGTNALWYRQQFVSTINATVFAEHQITLMGGWLIIPKDAGVFASEVSSAATQIDFGKALAPNDWVLVRAHDKSGNVKVEYLRVGSLVSGTTYNVTRDLQGAHATDPNWAEGVPFCVLGANGNGRIELNAYDTPRIQIIKQGAAYNTATEMARLGDLNGNWGYSAETYGIALGEYAASKANLTWDPTNGLRLRTYTTTVIQLDNSGNADITGKLRMPGTSSAIAIGSTPPTAANTGTGIWIDRTGLYSLSSGTYQVKIDATDGKLYAGGGDVVLSSGGLAVSSKSSFDLKAAVKIGSGYLWSESSVSNGNVLYVELGQSPSWYGQIRMANGSSGLTMNFTLQSVATRSFNFAGAQVNMTNGLSVSGGLLVGAAGSPASGYVYAVNGYRRYLDGAWRDGGIFVPLASPLTASAWDGTTFSSASKTKIDLSAVFGVPGGIKAVLFSVTIRDSASIGSDARLILSPNNTSGSGPVWSCGGQTNNTWSRGMLTVPCDANGDVYYQIAATGTNSMTIYLAIWGYWV